MRNYGQRLCPRCAQLGPCDRYVRVCPVTDEIRQALARFARDNGRRWKSILCEHWMRACADLSEPDRNLLQQARNILGPARLYKIRIPKVIDATPEVQS